jgi:hypothetical protein
MKNLELKAGDVQTIATAGGFRCDAGQELIGFTVVAHYAGVDEGANEDQVAVIVAPGWVVEPLGQLAAALGAVEQAGQQEIAERQRREAS